MCAIFGVMTQGPLALQHVHRAMDSMQHRGPDDRGLWSSDDGRVLLAHNRLSIVDLAGGHQPLLSAAHDVVAVVNGEIYGHRQLRASLQQKGYPFQTHSDSEVLLALYLEHGSACLEHLRGEFSFVIWDQRKQQVFAARDRFGVKPLFYYQNQDTFFIASEIKALLAMGAPAVWDVESVYDFDSGILHNDRTFFKNIKQIAPGHFILVTQGHLRTVSYWDLEYCTATQLDADRRTSADYVEEFRQLFTDAVKVRLEADVPVGCYLSGGLDSCSILGMANSLSARKLEAFTISFDDDLYDEYAMAEEMAALAGSRLHRVDVTQQDLADHFDQAVWHAESLFINPHGIAKYILSRKVREQGIKVVLTGEGADEILAGYPIFRQDMLMTSAATLGQDVVNLKLEQLKQANKTSIGLLLSEESGSELAYIKAMLGYIPAQLAGSIRRFKLYSSFYTPAFSKMLNGRDSIAAFLDGIDVNARLEGRDSVNQSLYLWCKTSFPNYMLSVLGDRMEMAHSIEGRPPFLDHPLAEFCARLPVHQKIHLDREKHLLREAARDLIPQRIYDRQKQPFMAPTVSRHSFGALQEFICDTLSSTEAQSLPFYDTKKLLALVNNLPNLPVNVQAGADALLVQVASACSMQKQFGLSM